MQRLSWLISMGISLFGVMIIEHFFAMTPGDSARSGNLGAFGLALVAPFLLLSFFTTYRFFFTLSHQAQQPIFRLAAILLGILFVSVMYNYAIDYQQNVYANLGGTHLEEGSVIYGYPLLNQYTNQVFVNLYTYAFVHGVIALVGAIIGMLKKPNPAIEQS